MPGEEGEIKISGGIVHPERFFVITMGFKVPPDMRTDEWWKAYLFGGVTLCLDRHAYGQSGGIEKTTGLLVPRP